MSSYNSSATFCLDGKNGTIYEGYRNHYVSHVSTFAVRIIVLKYCMFLVENKARVFTLNYISSLAFGIVACLLCRFGIFVSPELV